MAPVTPEYDFSISNLRLDLKKLAPQHGTPIRTRGRKQLRSTKQSTVPLTNNTSSKSDPRPPPSSSSARIHSIPTFAPELPSRKKQRKSKHPRTLSTIESLPFDILEQIFLECLNVNFPRALQRVGQVLSTERVYRHFVYRIYCKDVHTDHEGTVTLSPPGSRKDTSEKTRIKDEREAILKARSAGLTCRWATYPFFRSLHKQINKSPNLWMGLFSCSIPRKLLKAPMTAQDRKFLLALSSLSAKLDNNTLDQEDADVVWRWAAREHEGMVLQCLMEPRFGFKPSREQRLAALESAGYNLDVVRLFKDTRVQDPKNGYLWPQEWPEGWPLGDPKAEAELSERYGVEAAKLKELIDTGCYLREWKVGFGGDIPSAKVMLRESS